MVCDNINVGKLSLRLTSFNRRHHTKASNNKIHIVSLNVLCLSVKISIDLGCKSLFQEALSAGMK